MSNDDANGFPSLPGTPNGGSAPPPPPPGFGPPTSPPPATEQPPAYGQQPPAYGQQPPASSQQPPAYGAPGAPPPGYAPTADGGMVKGPRPDVKVGGILVAVGALLSIVSVFLPWATGSGASVNGMDDFIFLSDGDLYLAESPGTVPIVFGVVMLALGVTLILAGRVLAVAIIAIVGAVIAEFIGLAMVGIASGLVDDVDGASVGLGAIIQPIAPLISLAGAIVATSKRRRMVPASSLHQPPVAPGTPPSPPGIG